MGLQQGGEKTLLDLPGDIMVGYKKGFWLESETSRWLHFIWGLVKLRLAWTAHGELRILPESDKEVEVVFSRFLLVLFSFHPNGYKRLPKMIRKLKDTVTNYTEKI